MKTLNVFYNFVNNFVRNIISYALAPYFAFHNRFSSVFLSYILFPRFPLVWFPPSRLLPMWHGGATDRALDLRSTDRGFKSYSRQSCVTTLASCSHLCASVIMQYNLVPAKGRWCSAAGKVSLGLTESNGWQPTAEWMTYSHLRADCLTPGLAPDPTLGNEYGKPFYSPPAFSTSVLSTPEFWSSIFHSYVFSPPANSWVSSA